MCFSLATVPLPGFYWSYEYLSICFLISEIRYFRIHVRSLRNSILWILMITMSIATVILFLSSPHYNSLKDIFRLFKSELLIKYYVIAYTFICLKREKDFKIVYKASLIGLSILTFFAIINYVQGQSDFVSMMLNGRDVSAGDVDSFDVGQKYSSSERFRVQSMFVFAFDYGYVCAAFLLFYLLGIHKKYISRGTGIYSLCCCSFGIVVCNCRTILFGTIITVIVFYFIYYGKKMVKYLIVSLLLAGTIYMSSDTIAESFNSKLISIFENGGDVSGSSLAMRAIQYVAVISHVEGHYVLGRGKDYFVIDLGWGDGRENALDPDLQGLEGILLNLLLERGLVGILFWFLFYGGLLLHFFKKRFYNIEPSALGIACITLYLLYSNMTGEMGCVFPTMLILGVAMSNLYSDRLKGHIVGRNNNLITKK